MQPAAVWSVSCAQGRSRSWPRSPRDGLHRNRARGCQVRGWRRRHSARASASDLPIRHSRRWLQRSSGSLRSPGKPIPTTERARSPERPGRAMPIRTMTCRSTGSLPATRSAPPRSDTRRQGRRGLLVINASPRSEHTCPGEMSKSWRLAEIARSALEGEGIEVELLDLSRVTSEYGRHIHPCKACFSTAAPLCHWPCSCYPNHSLGQTQDWMNDIYPMWVAAHGVMIITPVNWYQVSAPLKLMMDRLVCADGGNPDPTLTGGKDAGEGEGDRARRLGLSAPPRGPPVLGGGAWRRRGSRECPALGRRLAALHEARAGGTAGRARPLHRLLGALRHEPRGARQRRGDAGRSAQRRADACRGADCAARRGCCPG